MENLKTLCQEQEAVYLDKDLVNNNKPHFNQLHKNCNNKILFNNNNNYQMLLIMFNIKIKINKYNLYNNMKIIRVIKMK